MTPGSIALLYALAAIGLGAMLLPLSTIGAGNWRAVMAWILGTIALLVFADPDIVLTSGFLILLALAPLSPVKRIAFFLATVPFLPGYLESFIPFPGINYLAVATPVKICTVVLLVPLLFAKTDGARAPRRKAVGAFLIPILALRAYVPIGPEATTWDRVKFIAVHAGLIAVPYLIATKIFEMSVAPEYVLIVLSALVAFALLALTVPLLFHDGLKAVDSFLILAFCVYTYLLMADQTTATAGFRFLADQLIIFALPYFVITRALKTQEDLDQALGGLLLASLVLAAIALVSTVKQWNFFFQHAPPSIWTAYDYRGGFLRVTATTNTHSLGFYLTAGILILPALQRSLKLSLLRLMALRLVMVAGLFFTGSRGAMAALAIGLVVYTVLSLRKAAFRWVMIFVAALVAVLGARLFMGADYSKFDPYGTFDYRQQLLTTSIGFINDHLLFGSYYFLQSGRFDHLIQGQGIVDVTNLYLQIMLQYGLVGLMLFLALFFSPMAKLATSLLQRPNVANIDAITTTQAALLSALVGWLVLVATTSDFGLTLQTGISLLALGQATAMITVRSKPKHLPYQQAAHASPGAGRPVAQAHE